MVMLFHICLVTDMEVHQTNLFYTTYVYIVKNDVVLTAIYEYHTDRTYEIIRPHICT